MEDSPRRSHTVPRDGDRVTASGVVEVLEGQLPRLCFRTGGRRPRRPGEPCPAGIDVPGLDPTQVVDGRATVVGTLHAGESLLAGTIAVEQQEPHDLPPPVPRPAVPCPPPRGGWAPGGEPFDDRSPDDAAYNAFIAEHQELIGRVLLLKPAPDRQVATVLARDADERDMLVRELGPSFPGRLCVVVPDHDVDAPRGRWTT